MYKILMYLSVHEESSVEEVLGATRVLRSKCLRKVMEVSVDHSSSTPSSGDNESVEKSRAAKARSIIDWKNQRVRLAFFSEIKKQKAHMKTGVSTKLKFQTIAANLAQLELFEAYYLSD